MIRSLLVKKRSHLMGFGVLLRKEFCGLVWLH